MSTLNRELYGFERNVKARVRQHLCYFIRAIPNANINITTINRYTMNYELCEFVVSRDSSILTFLENSDPTNRFLLQTEQSKLPAHLSVVTGVDIGL